MWQLFGNLCSPTSLPQDSSHSQSCRWRLCPQSPRSQSRGRWPPRTHCRTDPRRRSGDSRWVFDRCSFECMNRWHIPRCLSSRRQIWRSNGQINHVQNTMSTLRCCYWWAKGKHHLRKTYHPKFEFLIILSRTTSNFEWTLMQRNLWHEVASVEFVSRSWCLGSCIRFVALLLLVIINRSSTHV